MPTGRRLREAAILHQMICHQTLLHLGADRDMTGWRASTGHVPRIHCWCFRPIQQTVPQFVGLALRPRGIIYLQNWIDSAFLHPRSHCTTNILVMPKCWCCEVLLMVCFSRSLSYVMCMGCFFFLLLGGIYFVTDMKGWWAGLPFVYPDTVFHKSLASLCYPGVYVLVMIKTTDT